MTLLLPWFPIVLAVGVGARLLGRPRGLALGVLCALFWVVLVQASAGVGIWRDLWTIATMMAGSIAIIAIGAWSGETSPEPSCPASSSRAFSDDAPATRSNEPPGRLQHLSCAIERFDDWLEEHRRDGNPWPKFDEFIRSVMHECCQAAHVRPYRLVSEKDELVPLRESDPLLPDIKPLSPRRGIVGNVVTTGRSYVADDATQGELVHKLADQSPDATAWCFAIRQGTRRLGVVLVGRLGVAPERNKPLLHAVEQLVNQFWCTLAETIRSRSAVQLDPVSGLRTRPTFLHAAEESLRDSYRLGEPVALAVIALEGLRRLNDAGRWELADELIREVSDALRQKVRMDDRLGRFDESRFIVLVRRVDSQLASLIVSQILARLTTVCQDEARWGAGVGVRCSVVGSGTEKPDLRTLVSRALVQCHRARREDIPIASDLGSVPVGPAL